MKIIKSLGSIFAITAPLGVVLACNNNNNPNPNNQPEAKKEITIQQKELNGPSEGLNGPKKDLNSQKDDLTDKKEDNKVKEVESVPLVKLKSQEEVELDEFEAKWGYRPKKPLKAYPKMTRSKRISARSQIFDFNISKGFKKWNYTYFLENNKQDIYKKLDGKKISENNTFYGDVVFWLSDISSPSIYDAKYEVEYGDPIYAIYYEIYDFAHEEEVRRKSNFLYGDKDKIYYDYKEPYSAYVAVKDENGATLGYAPREEVARRPEFYPYTSLD